MIFREITVLFCVIILTFGKEEKFDVDVKPGGTRISIIHSMDSITCSFEYVAQGGTNEKWQMTISVDNNNIACFVYRPDGKSYLFFQDFVLKTSGFQSITEAHAYSNGLKPLSSNEFTIDRAKKEVRAVSGKFQSQLVRLEILQKGQVVKDDL